MSMHLLLFTICIVYYFFEFLCDVNHYLKVYAAVHVLPCWVARGNWGNYTQLSLWHLLHRYEVQREGELFPLGVMDFILICVCAF